MLNLSNLGRGTSFVNPVSEERKSRSRNETAQRKGGGEEKNKATNKQTNKRTKKCEPTLTNH